MYSRRKYLKNVYSPSMRKATSPNYYQQKGRTIQQSPLRIFNAPTEMITRDTLKKMYNMLLDYKYPIQRPLINIPGPFIYILSNTFATMFPGDNTQSHIYGPDFLRAQMAAVADQFPVLPSNYHYEYRLAMFGVQNDTESQENMQFHIDWHSNLLMNGVYQIFLKTVDTAIVNIGLRIGSVTPTTGQNIYVPRMSVLAGGGVTLQNNPVGTNDPDPTDQLYYPMIDTSASQNDLYYGYFEMVPNNGYDNTPGVKPFIILSVGVFATLNP